MPSRELSDLHPIAREKAARWKDDCRKAGIDVLIYCTYRSEQEQAELYKVGRIVKGANASPTKPFGDTVTDAKPGDSFHQWRCAWDAVPLLNGKPQWGDNATYAKMGVLAAAHGIEWAWNWKKFKERAHFQYTGGLTLKDFKAGKEINQ